MELWPALFRLAGKLKYPGKAKFQVHHKFAMNLFSIDILASLLLFALMPVCAFLGHRHGRRVHTAIADAKDMNTGVVDAAILSLLGLLTAFTFSSAYSRFELRRQLIVDEVNAIGTAYLRLDLLPPSTQPDLRQKFREYTKSRYEFWQLLPDRAAVLKAYEQEQVLQKAIWTAAVQASENEQTGDGRKLLIPALNDMIDITTTRLVAAQSHPPLAIFLLLGALSLVAAWIVGFGMSKLARMSYVHIFGFSAMASLSLFVILDIEFPRHGMVTLNGTHELFLDLEKSMH